MGSIFNFLTEQHDVRLVLLAIAMAAACSFVTFTVFSHLLARNSLHNRGWLLLTVLCLATGIWASHVIMALALLADGRSYNPLLGGLSFLAAAATSATGIVIAKRDGRAMAAAGGATIGLGIALTHFLGMSGFGFAGVPEWSPALAAFAATAGAALCAAAFLAFREYLGTKALLFGAPLLAASIAITLLTAQAAFSLTPHAPAVPGGDQIDVLIFTLAIAAITALLLTAGFVAALLDGRAMRATFSRLDELVDAVFDGVVIAHDGKIVDINARVIELSGRRQQDLAGRDVFGDLMSPKRRSAAPGATVNFESSLVTAAGPTIPVQVLRRPLHSFARANEVYVLRDLRERREGANRITELTDEIRQYQQDLRRRNFLLEGMLNNVSEGWCMFDADQCVTISNERYAALYGLSPEVIKPGTHLRDIIQMRIDKGLYTGASPTAYLEERLAPIERASETLHELTDGRLISINRRPMPGGGWVTIHKDVTEQRRMEAENQHLAGHDSRTDLPNRELLSQQLSDALIAAARNKRRLVVLIVNLDNFREVNNSLGHAAGDALLAAVAERLREHTRKSTILGRFGDDEFVLVEAVDQPGRDAAALAGRIQQQLRAPFNLNGTPVTIETTMGIAISPGDGTDADTILKSADLALYRAKKEVRGSYLFFEPTMERQLKDQLSLEHDLREALLNGEFELHYQPIVNLQRNAISGFEALLRWNHPARGLVSPAVFLETAEKISVISAIDEWTLRQACSEASQWPDPLKVAINISPARFQSRDFVRGVISALASTGLNAQRLEIEISETIIAEDKERALATLRQLSDIGVQITLDDFGTGFASLNYLREFPIQRIKIDRSFMSNLSRQPDSQVIVRTLARLGAGLGIATTAEGVETQEQFELVRSEGYTEMQGYYFSPPKRAQEIQALFQPKSDSAVA